MPLSIIGIDADDTLWHTETVFRLTHKRFNELLAEFGDADALEAKLAAVERDNMKAYGYGAKGFTLSMLQTALEVSGGRVSTAIISELLQAGREMMTHPIEPLPGVEEALRNLAERAPLVLITKGDLFHQESKLAGSGLGSYFSGVEIVSEKTPDIYVKAFARHGASPERAMMAGNSVKSDILPVIAAGAYAALIPYPLVWEHERAEKPAGNPRFREMETLGRLPEWVDQIG
ncbi:MAG TPA: HAD family hydrolase [Hyphomonadaceae bacterium]|nr:HAD family hydrolase [Hyphomonadaceae bacterium]